MASMESASGELPCGCEPSGELDTTPPPPEHCFSDLQRVTLHGNDTGDDSYHYPVDALTDKLLDDYMEGGEDCDSLFSFQDPILESRSSSPNPLIDLGSNLPGTPLAHSVEWAQKEGRCVTSGTQEDVPPPPPTRRQSTRRRYPWFPVHGSLQRRLRKIPKRLVPSHKTSIGKRKKRLVCYRGSLRAGGFHRTRRGRNLFTRIPHQKHFAKEKMIHDFKSGDITEGGGGILPVDSKGARPDRTPRLMRKLRRKGTVSFSSRYSAPCPVVLSPATHDNNKVYLTPNGLLSATNPPFPNRRSKKTRAIIKISQWTNLMMKRNPHEPPRMATISFRGFITTKGEAEDYISSHCNKNRELPIEHVGDLPAPPGKEVTLAS